MHVTNVSLEGLNCLQRVLTLHSVLGGMRNLRRRRRRDVRDVRGRLHQEDVVLLAGRGGGGGAPVIIQKLPTVRPVPRKERRPPRYQIQFKTESIL